MKTSQRKRTNLLKYNLLDFDFFEELLKDLKSLMVVFLESLKLQRSALLMKRACCYYFLSYLGKFKRNLEVLDFCSMRVKDPACFIKKVVNNALIRVTTSLIFKNSFLG